MSDKTKKKKTDLTHVNTHFFYSKLRHKVLDDRIEEIVTGNANIILFLDNQDIEGVLQKFVD